MSTIDLFNTLNGMKLSDMKVLARHLGFYNTCVAKEDLIESVLHVYIDGLLKRTTHLTKMLAGFRNKSYALGGNDLLDQIRAFDPNAEVFAVSPCAESVWVQKVWEAIDELQFESKYIATGRNDLKSNNATHLPIESNGSNDCGTDAYEPVIIVETVTVNGRVYSAESRMQCKTAMDEFTDISFDEMRLEYYAAHKRTPSSVVQFGAVQMEVIEECPINQNAKIHSNPSVQNESSAENLLPLVIVISDEESGPEEQVVRTKKLTKRKRPALRIIDTESDSESEPESVPKRKKKVAPLKPQPQPSAHVRNSISKPVRLTPGYYGDTEDESDIDEFTEMNNFQSTDDDEVSIAIPDEKLIKSTIDGKDYLKYGKNGKNFEQLPVGSEVKVDMINNGDRNKQVCSVCRVQLQNQKDREFHFEFSHFGGFQCKCKKWFFSERGRSAHTCKPECEILTIKGGNLSITAGIPDYYVYAIPISRRNKNRLLIYRTGLGSATVAAHRKVNESERQKAAGFVRKNNLSVGCTSFNECMYGADPWQIHADEAFFLPMPGGNNHVSLIIRSFCRRMLNTKGHSVTLSCLTTLFDYREDFIERLQASDHVPAYHKRQILKQKSKYCPDL